MGKVYRFEAQEATREGRLLRMSVQGPTGSGKTLLALRLATMMRDKIGAGDIYGVDTEHKSMLEYAWSPRTSTGFKFKHVPMPTDDNSIEAYSAALDYCEDKGAGIIIIDSLSHAWAGAGGVLEAVDQITSGSRSRNAFSTGWQVMSPQQIRFIERIMNSPAHILATLRVKTGWEIQDNERGKKEPVKIGLAPVQREGVDYEFSLALSISAPPQHILTIEKSRALDWPDLAPGLQYPKPAEPFCNLVIGWLSDEPPPTPMAKPERDLFADPSPANRAKAYREAIEATTTVEQVDAIAARLQAEPHPRLKPDALGWCARRRAMFLAPTQAPATAPPASERPTVAGGAAPVHDDAGPPSTDRPAVPPPPPSNAPPAREEPPQAGRTAKGRRAPAQAPAEPPMMSDQERLAAIDAGRA